MPSHRLMPTFFLILACALWGLSFPVVKALQIEQSARLPGYGSEFLSAWIQVARFGIGALILLPFAWRGGGPTRLEWRQGFWLALWGGLGMAIQADALAYTDASVSAFLTQAYCVFLPLIVCLRTRRGPGSRTVLATVLVLVGGAILSGIRPGSAQIGRGEAETLVAAGFFALQILTLENPVFAKNRSTPVTWTMCAGIALLMLPIAAITAPSPDALIAAGASWPTAALIMVLAVFCSVGAFLLMNHWQPRISAVDAGLIYTTEPVFAAIYAGFLPGWIANGMGVIYSNETYTPTFLLGGALILIANLLMQANRPAHPPAIAPAP